ncbi:hypothetical protein [Devosia sp. CN2-171]|uniref:hypothetical protein n=1 Tax=Devosia sp. CN2-171 TaxID=3400909 RepID=UPI003BF910F0
MITPYFFALAPAPCGDSVAAIWLGGKMDAPELSILGSHRVTSFPFAHFEMSGLAWSDDGLRLAGFHGQSFILWKQDLGLTLRRMEHPITGVGFLGNEAYFVSGRTLFNISPSGELLHRTKDVVEIAFSKEVMWLRRVNDGHRVECWNADGLASVTTLPGVVERTTIAASADGRWLACAAWSELQWPKADLLISLLDGASGELARSDIGGIQFDVGLGTSKLPVAVTASGDVVVQLLQNGRTRLLCVAKGAAKELTPDDLDVQDFVLDPTSSSFAAVVTAVGGRGPPGMSLIVGDARASGARGKVLREVSGSFDMLRWSLQGSLHCAKAQSSGWQHQSMDPRSAKVRRRHRARPAPDFRVFPLAGPPESNRALVLVASPFRLLRAGPQTLFFQHALYGIASAAGELGYRVLGIAGPTSPGGGTEWLLPNTSLAAAWGKILLNIRGQLRKEGCVNAALLAGSLGAYVSLTAMRDQPVFDVAALVSPVIRPTRGAVPNWPPILDSALLSPGPVSATRVLVAYGSDDSLTTESDVKELQMTFGAFGKNVVLPGEGHIFRKPSSWRTVSDEILQFLAA